MALQPVLNYLGLRSASELDGPGDLVGKSVHSTSASQMAKHFRHDLPFHWEIEPINTGDTTDESAVPGEYSDSMEASAARWQASEELSTFLGATRKPLSKFDKRLLKITLGPTWMQHSLHAWILTCLVSWAA